MDIYRQHRTLVLAVITRWGSQFSMINGLLQNSEALLHFTYDARAAAMLENVLTILSDRVFWGKLEELAQILRLIREAQRMSGSDSAHLGQVISRWSKIQCDLSTL